MAIAGPSPIRQLWRLERRGYPLNLDLVLANSAAGSFLSGALLDDSENPAYVPTANGQLAIGYGFRQRFSHRHAEDLLGRLFVALYQSSPVARMLLHADHQDQVQRLLISLEPDGYVRPCTASSGR